MARRDRERCPTCEMLNKATHLLFGLGLTVAFLTWEGDPLAKGALGICAGLTLLGAAKYRIADLIRRIRG